MWTIQHISAAMLLIAGIQGIFFAMLLIDTKRGHDSSNRILAWLFLALASGYIAIYGELVSRHPLLIGMFHVLMLVMIASVPLLYLYIKTLTISQFHVSKRNSLHFLPLGAGILYLLIFKAPMFDLAESVPSTNLDHQSVVRIIWVVYTLPYLPAIRKLTAFQTRKTVELYRAGRTIGRALLHELNVHVWIRNLLIVCCVYWLLNIVSLAYPDMPCHCSTFTFVSVTMIYLLGFITLRNPQLIAGMNDTISEHTKEQHGGTQ